MKPGIPSSKTEHKGTTFVPARPAVPVATVPASHDVRQAGNYVPAPPVVAVAKAPASLVVHQASAFVPVQPVANSSAKRVVHVSSTIVPAALPVAVHHVHQAPVATPVPSTVIVRKRQAPTQEPRAVLHGYSAATAAARRHPSAVGAGTHQPVHTEFVPAQHSSATGHAIKKVKGPHK
jgi:hypothetical protein